MKVRLILLISALLVFSSSAFAEGLDISSWYSYNGYSNLHSFSVRFPQDWQVITLGDSSQGLSPIVSQEEDPLVLIEEHQNRTYDQVINYYIETGQSVSEVQDILIQSIGEDIMGKELSYVDSGGVVVKSLTVVKRGSLIVAMVVETDQYQDIISSIIGSFTYTDNWNSYLDFEDSYSFIFPANLILTYLGNGVEVSITSEIFSILKYENSTIDQAIEDSKGEYEIVADEVDIFFHTGDTATSVTFTNTKYDKQLSRIYLSKGKDIFVLNDINIEDNFPHPNTYDDYIFEMLESFEFFDVELSSDYITFDNFQDVRDTHPNEESINSLYSDSIIEGYADGTFRPDNQINRAELTKMLVASKLEPSSEQYNNCFTDVKTEWYAPYICYAKEQGWVAGYEDGSYQPGTDINRVEALKIMLEVLFDGQIAEEEILQDASALDIDSDAWYIKYFTFADNRDLLDMQHSSASEDGYHFFPADAISRKEVAETIYRAMKIN